MLFDAQSFTRDVFPMSSLAVDEKSFMISPYFISLAPDPFSSISFSFPLMASADCEIDPRQSVPFLLDLHELNMLTSVAEIVLFFR